jgi:integrase
MHGTLKKQLKYLHRPKDGIIYFRVGGKTLARLPDDEHSAEFDRAYQRLLAEHAPRNGQPRAALSRQVAAIEVGGIKRYRAPQIGYFVERWLASDFFAPPDKFKPTERPHRLSTQHNYRLGLNLMRNNGVMDVPLLDLTPRYANLYIQKVKRERGGATARLQKNLLSNIWKYACKLPEFNSEGRGNPMHESEVAQPYTLRQEHKDWPDDVQDRFLGACDANLHLAFHLLLCTGQRISDVVKMKWADYDGSHIVLVQTKGRDQKPMKIRAPKVLQKLLERRARVSDYILTHKWGGPYTRDSLTHRIKDVLKANGDAGYTTHGLRKNAGIMLALNGATVPVIMACLGHKTEKMAIYYVRLANQPTLADQGADIMDEVFARRSAAKAAAAAAKRAQIRRVK